MSQLNVTFAPVPCSVKGRCGSRKRAIAAPRLTAAAYPPPTHTTSPKHTSGFNVHNSSRRNGGKESDERDEIGGVRRDGAGLERGRGE